MEPRLVKLRALAEHYTSEKDKLNQKLKAVQKYLSTAGDVTIALDQLSEKLFEETTELLEANLTTALCEVLGQELQLKVTKSTKRGAIHLDFTIERLSHSEDILKGQGGSVANVLAVGLRLLILSTFDEGTHRRFLVLDEQDCWVSPDLIPQLTKIIYKASHELGFQVLVITHHNPELFSGYADKIYRLEPGSELTLQK